MRKIPSNVRNQRISSPRQRKKQHVIEVKLRESTERARRIRAIVGAVCKLTLFIGLGVGAWLGGKEGLRRFLWENPDYFISEINFTTDGALTREQVLSAAGVVENINIFTVDIGKARATIEQMPQVESAVVQRHLPNRMSVTVAERRPIAWVAAKGDEDPSSSERSFLIDARGIVLRSRVTLPEYYHLPIISGFETENLVLGKRVPASEMQAALELVRLNTDNLRFQVRNIDLSKGYCLLVTDQRRAKITFGLDNIGTQLKRLERYLDRADQERREIQTINLIVERNTPVTFHDPEAEAAAAAAAAAVGEEPPAPAPAKPAAATTKAATTDKTPARKAEAVKASAADASKKPDAAAPKSSPKPTPTSRGGSNANVKKPFRLNP